jgi:hypothetical protein
MVCITSNEKNLIFISLDDNLLVSANIIPHNKDILGDNENKYLYYTALACKIDSRDLNENIKQYIFIENFSTKRKIKINLKDFFDGDFDKIFIAFGDGISSDQHIFVYSENHKVFWSSDDTSSKSTMEIIAGSVP